MTTLRTEIIESQKSRSDLLKWKIILVAGLGATGLGLSKDNMPQAPLLIALMPLVCIYVDILCAHLNLRMESIGDFLSKYGNNDETINKYEIYSNKAHHLEIYVLENWALTYSTYFICVITIPVGIISYNSYLNISLCESLTNIKTYIFVTSSLIAAISEYRLNKKMAKKMSDIKEIEIDKQSA